MHVSSCIEAFVRIENSDLLSSGCVVANVEHAVYRTSDTAKIMERGHNIGPVLNSMLFVHLFVDVVEVLTKPVDSQMKAPEVSHEKLCSQKEVRQVWLLSDGFC